MNVSLSLSYTHSQSLSRSTKYAKKKDRLEYAQCPAIDKAAALLFFDLAEFFSGLTEFPHKPTRGTLWSNSFLRENFSFLFTSGERISICLC